MSKDNTSELREQLKKIYMGEINGIAVYPADTDVEQIMQLITSHTNEAIADVLDRLKDESVSLYPDKDAEYVSMSVIQAERQKLTNKDVE